jgi:hypothetical protein
MNSEISLLLAINKYLTICKHDSRKSEIVRRYLRHKVDRMLQKQTRKPRILVILGLPINLLLF